MISETSIGRAWAKRDALGASHQHPPAGWYTDPSMPNRQRYWNGAGWTNHTAPLRARRPSNPTGYTGPTPGRNHQLLVVGWLTAFFFPPVAIAIAISLLSRDEPGYGVPMLIVSALMLVLVVVWATSASASSPWPSTFPG